MRQARIKTLSTNFILQAATPKNFDITGREGLMKKENGCIVLYLALSDIALLYSG